MSIPEQRIRITLEIDAGMVADFNDTEGITWTEGLLKKENLGLMVWGELGDVLDEVTHSEFTLYKVDEEEGIWEEVGCG